MKRAAIALVALGAHGVGRAAYADDLDDDTPARSPVSSHLDRDAIERRGDMRPGDLVRDLPLLAIIGRANGAEASEYLVRGFASQGDELAVFVDGVPVNLVTHAAGAGYADLGGVIPSTIGSIDLHLGAYAARYGELATAGALELWTIATVPHGHATSVAVMSGSELGSRDAIKRRVHRALYRVTAMTSSSLGPGDALVAAEVGIADGAFVSPQQLTRASMLAKWTAPLGGGVLAATATVSAGRWFDSGVVPPGEVDAFGSIDPTQGGDALRTTASVAFSRRDVRVAAYVVGSGDHLYLNDSLFLRDPDAGDQVELLDRRVVVGFDAYQRRAHRRGAMRIGVQARSDDATTELWHTERRNRVDGCFGAVNPCFAGAPRVRQIALYGEDVLALGARTRLETGVRLDGYFWDVGEHGSGAVARVGPRLGVVHAIGDVELSAHFASGVHATDVRAVADSAFGAYARTWTGELGARAAPSDQLRAAFAVWYARVAEYRAWQPELATIAAVPRTTRIGADATVAFAPRPWLAVDAYLAVARAQTVDGDPVPGAPHVAGGAGVSVGNERGFVALRVRALGARATAVPDLPTESRAIVDVVARKRWRGLEVGISIDNLLDRNWRDRELAGPFRASRIAAPREDLLFAPGVPLSGLATVGYGW